VYVIHTHTHKHTHTHTHTHTQTYTHIHTHTYIYIHTYIHTYIHMYIGRLCAFFRQSAPYAQPGYAFNVYNVSAADLRRFLLGPAPPETAANDMTFLRVALR
jgi:hypothetical protein